MLNAEELKIIISEAKTAANKASMKYLDETLKGEDNYPCGFAWVNIYGVKGNTKQGKAFKAAGIEKDYSGAYSIWNPGNVNVQNVDVKEAGASAAADVFTSYGFKAYSGSRLD
jgi:hypothetical protein